MAWAASARHEEKAIVTKEISITLDLIRFLAAFVVFVGHVSGARFTGGFLWQVAPYMGMAVAIFFVMSGFVIGYVTIQRETNASVYLLNRAARIYSVAVPAVLITLAADAAGRAVSPELYSASWGYDPGSPLVEAVAALTFMQKSLGANFEIGSDLPYWSINYEVFYYAAFGLLLFCRPVMLRVAAIIVVLAIGGLPMIAMMPLWAGGALLARTAPWQRIGRRLGWAFAASAILGFIAYELWSAGTHRLLATAGPAFRFELPQDYLISLLFGLFITGIGAVSTDIARLARGVERPVRWLAARTFSLYLYHLPIAQLLAALNPYPAAHPASRVIVLGGTLAIVFLLAETTELRKATVKRVLSTLFGHMPAKQGIR
jgi:peptidoglycan/LPS O-acetylase OafA/YrhL